MVRTCRLVYFNPRTPVGCDPANPTREAYNQISIHAPQWGATRRGQRFDRHRQQYFNPRTPVGCDKSPVVRRRSTSYFNPRTPVGCDHPHAALWSASIGNFNPRTPVGCDRSSRRCARPSGYFNPRTPVGCDRRLRLMAYRDSLFQSTHPSGVRQAQNRGHAATDNFNPRTPVGCDHAPRSRSARLLISIHAPQWGATWMFCNMPVLSDSFQSTHPSGVRPVPLVFWFANSQFQSTHPSGVRRAWTSTSYWIRNFNPRTPVGCDHPAAPVRGNPVISIHAPQWGATGAGGKPPPVRLNFNPRTPVGCDRCVRRCAAMSPNFNPRTPVGCDTLEKDDKNHRYLFQSTHPSGVRLTSTSYVLPPIYFDPRTPVGCDSHPAGTYQAGDLFQSTHPSGVRPRATKSASSPTNFNPRTPVGCDVFSVAGVGAFLVFQSTHPSGVRPGVGHARLLRHISIHAPQWGATRMLVFEVSTASAFQSTHPSGVRPRPPRARPPTRRYFNPRTPVGCDATSIPRRVETHNFNPRTPVGCDDYAGSAPVGRRISIHAPQWGATAHRRSTVRTPPYFNPRTPVGCDPRRPSVACEA